MSATKPAAESTDGAKPSRLKALFAWLRHPRVPASRGGKILVGSFACVLLSLPFFIALSVMNNRPEPTPHVVTLSEALEAWDEGKFSVAAELAEELQVTSPAEAAYVQGLLAARKAETLPAAEAKNVNLVAANYLQQARKPGFPKGRESEGLLALGKALYGSNQMAQARTFLDAAMKKTTARQRIELYRLLSAAALRDTVPQFPLALDYNGRYLNEKTITADQRIVALLDRGHIQLLAADLAGCRETLTQLATAPGHELEVELLAARLLIGEGQGIRQQASGPRSVVPPAATAKFEAAISKLRDVQARDRVLDTTGGQPAYWIGVAYLAQGDANAALEQFERTHTLYSATADGFASGLASAELLARANRDEDAITRYRTVLASIKTPESFQNTWISGKSLGDRLFAAYQEMVRKRHYSTAVEFARLSAVWFPKPRALELEAQALASWGREQLANAETLPPVESAKLLTEGRARLRKSARVYLDLAKLRKAAREYPDDLWNAAEQYLAGHAFRHASFVLEHYLDVELRRQRPRALVRLAEALLAQERLPEALVHLNECMDKHPRDASCFAARLLASQAHVEQGDLKQAEALLQSNLQSDLLTPASQEWREALFALGRLQFNAGNYETALRPLEEAVSRYPELPASIEARYLAAQSYQQLARQITDTAATSSGDVLNAAARGRVAQYLEAGLKLHEQVIGLLLHQQELRMLADADARLLRNSYFGRGSILFELARFEEAIQVYQAIAARYAQRPEVLDAYVQLSACYSRMSRDDEARSALVQAQIILRNLPADAPFAEVSNHGRSEWQLLLETLGAPAVQPVAQTPDI